MLYIPGDSRRVDAIVLVGQHHSLSDASRATIEKSEMKLGHNDYVLLNLWIFRESSHSDWQLGGNCVAIGQQWMKSPLLQGAALQLWQSVTFQEGGCPLALSMCHQFGLPPHS